MSAPLDLSSLQLATRNVEKRFTSGGVDAKKIKISTSTWAAGNSSISLLVAGSEGGSLAEQSSIRIVHRGGKVTDACEAVNGRGDMSIFHQNVRLGFRNAGPRSRAWGQNRRCGTSANGMGVRAGCSECRSTKLSQD